MPSAFKSSWPVERQISCGGILFRGRGTHLKVVLISRKGGTIWCLPKGLQEKGEKPQETALREVQEETGLTGRVTRKLGEISYWYTSKEMKRRFFKQVIFFLIRHTGGNPSWHDAEVEAVRWFPVEEAISRLTYPSERRLLERARRALQA